MASTLIRWGDVPDVKSDGSHRDRERLADAPPVGVVRVDQGFSINGQIWEIRKTACECCGSFMQIPRRIGFDFIPTIIQFTCPRCFLRRVVGLPGSMIDPPRVKRPVFEVGPVFVTQTVRQLLAAARDYHGRITEILTAHATGQWSEGGMGRFEDIADLTPDEAAVAPCLDRGRRNRLAITSGAGPVLTAHTNPRGPDRPAVEIFTRIGGNAADGEARTVVYVYGEQPTAAP